MKVEVHLPGKELKHPQIGDAVRTPTGRPGVITLVGALIRVRYTDRDNDFVDLSVELLQRPVHSQKETSL